KTSAYALITHCRFSCEKPRSVWIEGSATFTIAMSRTTMNCTVLSSASANHLFRSELTMYSDCRLRTRLRKGLTRRMKVRCSAPRGLVRRQRARGPLARQREVQRVHALRTRG